MIPRQVLKSFYNNNLVSSLCTQPEYQKSIQVSILGAGSRLGTYTSFLLKQNPLISTLHLQGCLGVEEIGKDLSHMDTSSTVHSYCGMDSSLEKAVKSADVVLILPTENLCADTPIGERIMKEGSRLHKVAVRCTLFAPRAILVVCVPPVSVTTPLVTEVFKKSNFYHPGRIIGSTAFAQVKANALLGRYQDLDPQAVYTPLIGGPDVDLAVPLFSQAKPVEVIGKKTQMSLTARYRGVNETEFPKISGRRDFFEKADMAESYGINMLVSTIALGLCGDQNAYANVFLRANLVDVCKYLVTTVRFSRGGVVHNCGLPQLNKHELDLLEKATLELKEREDMAKEYLDFVENKDNSSEVPSFIEKEKKRQELLNKRIVR